MAMKPRVQEARPATPTASVASRRGPSRVVARCLDAAGIDEPELRRDVEECRRLHAAHGRTYYLATWLLPPAKRPWVWALYGFARYADEFVDSLTAPDPTGLQAWSDRCLDILNTTVASTTPADDAPTRGLLATIRHWDLDPAQIRAFLASMRQDITCTRYETYRDLEEYMAGSAEAIAMLMLPILEPSSAHAAAPARALGVAFQLTNFIRDVGEDLDRGRVYLPAEDLDRFGVTVADLRAGRASSGPVAEPIRQLLAFEIERARAIYRTAVPGIALLDPAVRDAISCAAVLYQDILGAVEKSGYAVLGHRARVSRRRQAAVASVAYLRARRHFS